MIAGTSSRHNYNKKIFKKNIKGGATSYFMPYHPWDMLNRNHSVKKREDNTQRRNYENVMMKNLTTKTTGH